MTDAELKAQRAAARAGWPGLKSSLLEAPTVEALGTTLSPEQRLGLMWSLARDAWAMTGQPLPTYSRAEMPGRVIRKGER